MYWANFLHIYQPYGQQPDILEAVVTQSYRPLIEGTLARPRAKYTLNINASLLELFDQYGYHDLIKGLAEAGRRGQIEFTGSAKYHALLPFLSRDETLRQIHLNTETNRHYLGEAYQPKGIFLPEMAYDPKLASILEEAGFDWVLLDEIAYNGQVEAVDYNQRYRVKGSKLGVYFRERRLSNMIMAAAVRDVTQLKQALGGDLTTGRYLITGMDGETFGHHRIGLEQLLFEIFDDQELGLVRISDLDQHYPKVADCEPVASTWASSPQDITQGIQFISWRDPENPIHTLQWQLRDLTVEAFYQLPSDDPEWPRLRAMLDSALASDQFFWASAKPWWSFEQIEEGAKNLLEILQHLPGIKPEQFEQGELYYHQILATAFEWKRSGKLLAMERERAAILRIPFKERTHDKGGEMGTEWAAFLDMLKEQEQLATQRQEYEAAIMWRDASYKLEHKLDIYDAIHVVDLLRTKIPNATVEDTLKRYKADYLRIRGGQPEQRGA